MLSLSEFTVGSIGQATPLTLVLPRSRYEDTFLIGHGSNAPAALFLSGDHQFKWFESAGNESREGLLIPNVRIEVDETSVFHPSELRPEFGTIVRKGTQLVAHATNATRSLSRPESFVLEDGLPSTSNVEVSFLRWQIVLGSGREKRVLNNVSIGQT